MIFWHGANIGVNANSDLMHKMAYANNVTQASSWSGAKEPMCLQSRATKSWPSAKAHKASKLSSLWLCAHANGCARSLLNLLCVFLQFCGRLLARKIYFLEWQCRKIWFSAMLEIYDLLITGAI
jgi:hypothetical protein